MNNTSILFSALGLLVGTRTLLQIERRQLITRRFSRGLMIFWPVIVLMIARTGSSALQMLSIGVMIASPTIISRVRERDRKRALARSVRLFVDEMLFSIRAGSSYREALKSALGNEDKTMKVLRTMISTTGLQRPLPEWAARELAGGTIRAVLDLEHSSAKVADRLAGLRRSLIVAGKLQRKVKTAADPAKIQGLMVIFLYFGVCAYQFHLRPDFFGLEVFWISLLLVTLAGFSVNFLLRRFRWTLSRGL